MKEVNLSHSHSALMFPLQAKAAFVNSISVSKLNCSDRIFYCYCHRLLVSFTWTILIATRDYTLSTQ